MPIIRRSPDIAKPRFTWPQQTLMRSGRLRHAALDVFDTEPMAPGHELATLPNVTLSAHSAFRTPEASENLIRSALDIAKRLATG